MTDDDISPIVVQWNTILANDAFKSHTSKQFQNLKLNRNSRIPTFEVSTTPEPLGECVSLNPTFISPRNEDKDVTKRTRSGYSFFST